MCSLKRLEVLLFAMLTAIFTACGEEDEQVVPIPQNVSEARFDSCVNGKGWIHVSSHEVKQNGTLAKEEYWSNPDTGKPQQYFFKGDTLTTFLSTEAYNAEVYQSSRYTYKQAEHRLMSGEDEVFKLIAVSPDELCILQYKGFSGNGEKTFIYSVYRPMNAGELALCRRSHPYNVATINHDFPTLPEQSAVTAADFKLKAVGHGWKCAEAHRMETSNRYSAQNLQLSGDALTADNLYITADSLISFKSRIFGGFEATKRQKYCFRANSFSLETATGAGLKVLSLTADEMRLLMPTASNEGQEGKALYCVYRKMTAEELASTAAESHDNTATGS